jgi:hypothetical protein
MSELIFVGGLHRSGTTPFARLLAEHPDVSGLTDTGVVEDEGQHLQSVYPVARTYGGSGHFARDPRAHLTELSPLATAANAEALLEAWRPYWDTSRPYLVEKSPPNLVMGRFLQELFPDAHLLMVVRHPVTVALSTKKWTRFVSRDPRKFASLSSLVEHWLIAHRLLLEDMRQLRRIHVVHYEDLVASAEETLAGVQHFLGLAEPIPSSRWKASHGQSYQSWWDDLRSMRRPGGWQRREIERRFGAEIARYGYDLDDLSRHNAVAAELLV